MISLVQLKNALVSNPAVLTKFRDEREFSITAGEFASKVAPAYSLDKEAAALSKALGADTPLFRFRPLENGSDVVPVCVVPMVFADGDAAVIRGADLQPIEATFQSHKLGTRGHATVKIGSAVVEVPLSIDGEFRDDLINCLNDGIEVGEFEETAGAPPVKAASLFTQGDEVVVLRGVPQRDLPPWSDEVPRFVDLEVVAVLQPSRQYQSQRITVKPDDGAPIVGLICTAPIIRAITGEEIGGEITTAHIGQKFQILDVVDRRRRDGEVVKNEDGTVQKTVLASNTTAQVSFEL